MTTPQTAGAVFAHARGEEKHENRVPKVTQIPLVIAGCVICAIAAINLIRLTSANCAAESLGITPGVGQGLSVCADGDPGLARHCRLP